ARARGAEWRMPGAANTPTTPMPIRARSTGPPDGRDRPDDERRGTVQTLPDDDPGPPTRGSGPAGWCFLSSVSYGLVSFDPPGPSSIAPVRGARDPGPPMVKRSTTGRRPD